MNTQGNGTEPIIRYSAGTARKDHNIHGLSIHHFSEVTGIENVRVPEHSMFLVLSPVKCADTWQGEQLAPRQWMPGDIGFLPAGSEITSIPDQPYDETMIRVSDGWFRKAMSHDQFDGIDLRFAAISNPIISRIATTVSLSIVQHPPCPLLVESLAMTLSIAVANEITGGPRREPSGALSPRRKRRVIEYIESNIGDPITLSELASVAALSPHHFSRSFRRTFGVSPVRYVWSRRIDAAKKLLRCSATPLAAVAMSCGFASQSHFTTAFRMATGVTPTVYMRELTEQPIRARETDA